MLTGSTMALIGGTVYKVIDTVFIFNGQFRNKFEALVIFLGAMVITGWATLSVQSFWAEIVTQLNFSMFDLIGAALIIGMIAVNNTVPNWKYLDPKSVIVYGIGCALILAL
ncbi:hypothetical protein [Methanococcoides burtonii]|nr:hypothetical protein [Methanococcoides burtonii]